MHDLQYLVDGGWRHGGTGEVDKAEQAKHRMFLFDPYKMTVEEMYAAIMGKPYKKRPGGRRDA